MMCHFFIQYLKATKNEHFVSKPLKFLTKMNHMVFVW